MFITLVCDGDMVVDALPLAYQPGAGLDRRDAIEADIAGPVHLLAQTGEG